MKLADKAKEYAEIECGEHADKIYPTSLSQTILDVAIEDYSQGYRQALEDFKAAIKVNPKLSPQKILEYLEKEI